MASRLELDLRLTKWRVQTYYRRSPIKDDNTAKHQLGIQSDFLPDDCKGMSASDVLCSYIALYMGECATWGTLQLGALEWHSRGQRFDAAFHNTHHSGSGYLIQQNRS